MQELVFFCHEINHQGLRPDYDKVKAVKERLPPKTRPELQRVLAMAFVHQTLTLMISIKQDFVWGPSQQQAFDKWEGVLSSQPVLATYDIHQGTIVTADEHHSDLVQPFVKNRATASTELLLMPQGYSARWRSSLRRSKWKVWR